MSFFEYYQTIKFQPSPAATFVREIANLCERSEIAVRKWLAGENVPKLKEQMKIAAYLNIPVEELFPKSMSNNQSKSNGDN